MSTQKINSLLKNYNDEFTRNNVEDYILCVSPFDVDVLQGVSPRDIATLYNLASFLQHNGCATMINSGLLKENLWCYVQDPSLSEGGSKSYINSFLKRMVNLNLISISDREIMLSERYFSLNNIPGYIVDHDAPVIAIGKKLIRTLYAAGNKKSTTLPLITMLLVATYLHPQYRMVCQKCDQLDIKKNGVVSTRWLINELRSTFYPNICDDEIVNGVLLGSRYNFTPCQQTLIYQYSDKIISRKIREETLDDTLWRFLLNDQQYTMLLNAPVIVDSKIPVSLVVLGR